MPNPKLFPFTGMSFTLADGTQLQLDDAAVAAALQYSNTPCVAAGAQGSAWPCKLCTMLAHTPLPPAQWPA